MRSDDEAFISVALWRCSSHLISQIYEKSFVELNKFKKNDFENENCCNFQKLFIFL